MTARYFTDKSGKFKDALALKFEENGRVWFVKNDAERTLVACKFWNLQDAHNHVAKGHWIEVTEQYVLTPELLDRPQSEVDAW